MDKMIAATSDLRAALRVVEGVVSKRAAVPILRSVLIDDHTVVASNLDVEVRVSAGLVKRFEKPVALEYRALNDMTKYIDSENITFQRDKGDMKMSFDGSEYGITSYEADDFPKLEFTDKISENIHNAGIAAAVRNVSFAISKEETRYYLNGVCFTKDEAGKPHVVTTDGHRLAYQEIPFMPINANGKIVPHITVDLMAKQKTEPDTVRFSDKNTVRFTYPGMVVSSRLIDGTFPDWKRVVPKTTFDHFTVDLVTFQRTLKRIGAFRKRGHQSAASISSNGKNSIRLTGKRVIDYKTQEFSENVKAEVHHADEWACGFNIHYLIEICKAYAGCETITFRMAQNKGEPAKITGDKSAMVTVLMPMRV